jgi:FxsC-like protein
MPELYFFLSYAHSDPLAGYPQPNPDHLVMKFFRDLMEAVRSRASLRKSLVSGFFDQEIPAGSDLKKLLTNALSTAQVFVPLYSAGYLAKSWPGRELACFKQRVEDVGLPPLRRFVPVLWTPLPAAEDPPGLREALSHGVAEPDYPENGLRALLKIGSYHDAYQTVVNTLARQIVELAEGARIEPAAVRDIDEVKSEFLPNARLTLFVIEVAAPTTRTVAVGHDPRGYGATPTQWRPFPGQELTLAESAAQIAERFDFEARVRDVNTISEADKRRPGIVLIDPEFIATDDGQAALTALAGKLPPWVLPLVVIDQPDDERKRELATRVGEILDRAGALRTDSARRGARGIGSLDDFAAIVPVLVAEAERQYLRNRSSGVPSPPSGKRPRL